MSFYDYERSRAIEALDEPFAALVMAAMQKADDKNLEKLKAGFPEIFRELQYRYRCPGGLLPAERKPAESDTEYNARTNYGTF